MKIALVHDYLIQDGGAEKVLDVLCDLFPEAPIFTLVFDPQKMPRFAHKDVRTSFIQRLPFGKTAYTWYVGLMPIATEQYDLREFDIVISSTSAFAKGIITRPDALHICYCHTPTRYLWTDTASYIRELRVPAFIKWFLPLLLSHLRSWDQAAAARPDVFIANSKTVQERIKKFYRREAEVVYPPVETTRFHTSPKPKTFFLTGGRLVAYKRFDLVIDAFNATGLPLKIFGSGPVEADLRKRALGNIEFLGRVSEREQHDLYANARAFIHPQEEDFGITPVEAMASGTPVIAYKLGGATETVVEGISGTFFTEQTTAALISHVRAFDTHTFDARSIKTHAETFSRRVFEDHIRALIAAHRSS